MPAPAVAPIVTVQAIAHGLVRGALHRDVQRSVDAQAALIDSFGAVGAFKILADLLNEIRSEIVARNFEIQPHRLRDRALRRGIRNFSERGHALEHKIAAIERLLRMQYRRISGSANQSRQRRGFGQRQLPHRLAEIIFGSRLEPVIAMRQINLIAVHRQNLFFGVVTLDLQRQQRLLNLAAKTAVGAIEEQRARKLHRQRARAFFHAPVNDVFPGGARDAREIHAPVLLEMLVFG